MPVNSKRGTNGLNGSGQLIRKASGIEKPC